MFKCKFQAIGVIYHEINDSCLAKGNCKLSWLNFFKKEVKHIFTMCFMMHTLRITIFAIFISNILTKSENLIRFDKPDNQKKSIHHKTQLRNNTYITEEKINDSDDPITIVYIGVGLFFIYVILLIIYVLNRQFRWCNYRRLYDIRYIRRGCLIFRECCIEYIRNFPNDPPAPEPIIRYQPEPADYRDIYQIADSPV